MRVQYVNVYLVDQAYGGPEEGGWWYTYGVPQRSIAVKPSSAQRLRDKVDAWCDKENEDRPEMYSVASQGVYQTRLEEHPGKGWPSERPYYE